MNILLVEDDPIVADAVSMTLEQAGYFTVASTTIHDALEELSLNEIDAVLLDLKLPDGDGTRLARLIRAKKEKQLVPILVVSGNNSVDDRIMALGAGADGYLSKPFDKHELLAHLEAIIRRANGHNSLQIEVGNMMIDLQRKTVSVNGRHLALTRKEYEILNLLGVRRGAVLSKSAFISHLYGGRDEPESKIVDVFVCKLRHKLKIAGMRGVRIETVWGQGYKLIELEDGRASIH